MLFGIRVGQPFPPELGFAPGPVEEKADTDQSQKQEDDEFGKRAGWDLGGKLGARLIGLNVLLIHI
jgi:hypothetical protein